jgi:small subunit ribosomal protein S13
MRLLGITLPDTKNVQYGLAAAIYGIGIPKALEIAQEAKIDPKTKIKDLTHEQDAAIRKIVENLKLEGNLKREVGQNIKRLKDIGSYRGSRHARNLPSKGQRTKTNSRTVRGNKRMTMGSGRKKESKT